MKNGCKARCLAFLRNNAGKWIAKGTICDLARASDGAYTGEMTGRRLRELHQAKTIEGKEVDGHMWYRWVRDRREEFEAKSREAVKAFDEL